MGKGFFHVPTAINEPVKSYAPGSPERALVLAQYKEYFTKIPPKIIYFVAESFYNLDDYQSSCALLLGLKDSNLFDFNTSNFPFCFNI